ncbi:hypothetical protein KUTeg_020059, partial [Tegillarca granosa]
MPFNIVILNMHGHRREHEMIDMEDPEILDIMRKSTIPPSLSLRAPPANIALGGRREKLIGITSIEASERYMNKLQQDRDRNNQALQMTQTESLAFTGIDSARENPLHRSRRQDFYNPDASIKTYNLNRNCRSLPSPKSSKSQSTLQSKFSTTTNISTRYSQRKPTRKRLLDSIDPKLFGFEYDLDSMDNSINVNNYSKMALPYVPKPGFNGHPIKNKTNLKKSPAVPTLSTSEIMPSKYSKVIDSNQQVRFVYSSVALNSKPKANNPLPPILSEKRYQKESTDIFAISSVQKFNEPIKEQSVTDKRLQEKYLKARYQESPGNIPLVPMHSFNSETPISRAAHQNCLKSDTSSVKSNNSRRNSVDDDNLKVSISKTVLQSRENVGNNGSTESIVKQSESKDEVKVQPLSESTLHQHVSKIDSQKPANQTCDLTHISEREDSNLTTQSEQLQQMKIMIHYKKSDVDDIKERSEVSDSFAVPAWVSDAETDKEDTNLQNNIQKKETFNDNNSLQNIDDNSKVNVVNDENSPISDVKGFHIHPSDIPDKEHIASDFNTVEENSNILGKMEKTISDKKDNKNNYEIQQEHLEHVEISNENIETNESIAKSKNQKDNVDEDEDDFVGSTFLTAPVNDKPEYSFQKINPEQIRTNAIKNSNIKIINNVSAIQKSRTNLEPTNQNRTHRNNSDLSVINNIDIHRLDCFKIASVVSKNDWTGKGLQNNDGFIYRYLPVLSPACPHSFFLVLSSNQLQIKKIEYEKPKSKSLSLVKGIVMYSCMANSKLNINFDKLDVGRCHVYLICYSPLHIQQCGEHEKRRIRRERDRLRTEIAKQVDKWMTSTPVTSKFLLQPKQSQDGLRSQKRYRLGENSDHNDVSTSKSETRTISPDDTLIAPKSSPEMNQHAGSPTNYTKSSDSKYSLVTGFRKQYKVSTLKGPQQESPKRYKNSRYLFHRSVHDEIEFQKRYRRLFDLNKHLQFVNSSLVSGKNINNQLPPIGSGSSSNFGMFEINSVQKHNDPICNKQIHPYRNSVQNLEPIEIEKFNKLPDIGNTFEICSTSNKEPNQIILKDEPFGTCNDSGIGDRTVTQASECEPYPEMKISVNIKFKQSETKAKEEIHDNAELNISCGVWNFNRSKIKEAYDNVSLTENIFNSVSLINKFVSL